MSSTVIIIPSRLQAQRLPDKPLKLINQKEMILHVCEKAEQAVGIENVYVATENEEIAKVVRGNGYSVVITSDNCLTGTDRVAEASQEIDADIFVNVQGDEPLINADDIKKIIKAKIKFSKHVICGYSNLRNDESVDNKNIPKVVMNKKSELMYISRSAIPSLKGKKIKKPKFFKQVCIYGFSKNDLNLFSNFKKKTFLENYEDIEILRFLENGKKVKMIKLNSHSYAIDTYNDIQKVCKNSDLVILHTEWDEFKSLDFKKLVKNKKFKVFDLRNLYNQKEMIQKKIKYYSVGRPNIN
mgnify:CR=1 FL=1